MDNNKNRVWLTWGVILLVVGVGGGVGMAVLGMIGAFSEVASSEGGSSPAELSSAIESSLIWVIPGAVLAVLGLVLIVVALARKPGHRRG